MKYLLIFFCLWVFLNAESQDFKAENATQEFLKKIPEVIKSDKSLATFELNKAISQSLNNNSYKLGELYFWKGELFLSQALYDSAGNYYLLAIPLLNQEQDELVLGRAYIGAGYIYNFQTRYADALAVDLKAEKIFRKLNDRKMLARSLKRIGDDIYYNDPTKTKDAELYFRESITISEEEKDTLNIIRGLNAIATVLTEARQYKEVDVAMQRAVRLAEKINCIRCMAISYSQWGISNHKEGRFSDAIKKYRREFEMNKKMGSEYDQFFVYQNIAEALVGLNRHDEALIYSDSALRIVETDVAWNHWHDAYKVKYKAYKGKGDVANALISYEKQMQYRDSLYSEEKEKIMSNLRAAYDLERKESHIQDLENKNRISELEAKTAQQWQIGLVVFLILLMVVVGVLYNRYQLKQRTAKALDEKNEELQKLNGFKDRMFAVISHDLRNPVDAFGTIIESLNQNLQHASKEELKEFLETTLQSARDLKSLLNNLLEWSLVQIGKLPFHPVPVKVREILKQSSAHLETLAASKNISIEISDSENHQANADASMMTIVFRNLISNAIKFSPPDKKVVLQTNRENGKVIIAVKDQGIGMKADDVNKLFRMEESTRTIGNSSEKGAGIGLLLCKELVDRNNGRIYTESQPGAGSTFYVELPSA